MDIHQIIKVKASINSHLEEIEWNGEINPKVMTSIRAFVKENIVSMMPTRDNSGYLQFILQNKRLSLLKAEWDIPLIDLSELDDFADTLHSIYEGALQYCIESSYIKFRKVNDWVSR